MKDYYKDYHHPPTSTWEQLNELADKLEAAGVTSYSDEGKAITGKLGYGDHVTLGTIIWQRDLKRAVDAFPCDAPLKSYLVANLETRAAKKPERKDLRHFASAALRTTDQYHKPRKAWTPKGGCPLTLKLGEAVLMGHTQEAYADMSYYLVPCGFKDKPVTLDDEQKRACSENLGSFFRYGDTHTGLAGSGSNWSANLTEHEGQYFVLLSGRHSIMD